MTNIEFDSHALSQTYELGQARLRLRSDLRFTLHNDSTSPWYLVEDEGGGNYYRIGVVEYAFLSLLNGKRTLDEAIAQLASLACCDDLNENKAASLARWVIDSGLAETSAAKGKERIREQRKQESTRQMFEWMNPIAFRIPVFSPDALLTQMYRVGGFLAGWPVLLIWFVVCGFGALTLAMVWGEFWTEQIRAFSSFDFLWLAGTWLALKVFHELAHGLACKHYGGRVPQFGVLILLLIPLPYVDVSSSWRFSSSGQRILTSAAGMLIEAFIAALAIMIWASSSPGPVQYHMGNLFVAATINTLLFNANPLMKFDGYYILVDWVKIPNLYTRGRAFVKSLFKWMFFGVEFKLDSEPSRTKTRFVRAYGFAAMIWFVLICLSLGTAAISMLSGVGLLIAIAAMVLWIGIPLFRLAKYLLKKQETENPNRIRFVVFSGFIMAMLFGMAVGLPGPESVKAPVVIVEDDLARIRTGAAGFIEEIHVSNGQEVDEGELLVTMANPQLEADIAELKSSLVASRLRAKVYKTDGNLATWQIENETSIGLQTQLEVLLEQFNQLTIVAPVSGAVNAENFEELSGVYLSAGEELLSIGNSGSKHAVAMVAQHDAVWLRQRGELQNATIRLWGAQEEFVGKITEISPRATDRVPHFAFASNFGGPLTVVDRQHVDAKIEQGASAMRRKSANRQRSRSTSLVHFADQTQGQDSNDSKLVQQYVAVIVQLPATEAAKLRTGQAGAMSVSCREDSLGSYVYQKTKRWIRSKIQLTHGL